jgi:uncharacterized protein (DUF1330 family)
MSLRLDERSMADVLDGVDLTQPIGMLNLLKFREQALYAPDSGEEPCTAAEAYRRYGQGVMEALARSGAKMLLTGVRELIGAQDEWDSAFVVHYPTGQAFLDLVESPAYKAIVHHRAAAVADSRLLLMQFPEPSKREFAPALSLQGQAAD